MDDMNDRSYILIIQPNSQRQIGYQLALLKGTMLVAIGLTKVINYCEITGKILGTSCILLALSNFFPPLILVKTKYVFVFVWFQIVCIVGLVHHAPSSCLCFWNSCPTAVFFCSVSRLVGQ